MRCGISFGVLALALALGGGCASSVRTSWSKPGASLEEFERVSEICEHDSGISGLRGDTDYEVCMQRHGWFLVNEPAP